jgi:hypothetical protein
MARKSRILNILMCGVAGTLIGLTVGVVGVMVFRWAKR